MRPSQTHQLRTRTQTLRRFSVRGGTEVIQFQAVGIRQSAQIAGQVLTDNSVIVFVRLIVNGQVIFEVPGQAGRADLWSCAVLSNPGVFVDAFITPHE